jgi:hypothetical protein
MPCKITCLLATAFLISMIYFSNATTQSDTIKHYENQLPSNLKKIYNEISQERLKIYFYGYTLGLILSLIIIIYNYQIRNPKEKYNVVTITCTVITVSFITNYFYYMLSPKTKWMLNYVNTPEQTKAWLNMYKDMQKYYHTGFLLGLIAIALISIAFRC